MYYQICLAISMFYFIILSCSTLKALFNEWAFNRKQVKNIKQLSIKQKKKPEPSCQLKKSSLYVDMFQIVVTEL